MPSTDHIRLTDLSVLFDGAAALDQISLTVPKGGSLAVIGPSAAGKSVLLKVLAGLHRPTKGTVEVDGIDLSGAAASERQQVLDKIGVLFQQNALFDSLTNWENVAFRLLQQRKLSRKAAREKAVELLGSVGLGSETADLHPSDLSGGMQKRAGLARAIATEPDILLLDNPTAGLDPVMSTHINDMIEQIVAQNGATVVTVTTEMQAATSRYHDLIMLHEGKAYYNGPTSGISEANQAHLEQMLKGSAHGPITMRVEKRVHD